MGHFLNLKNIKFTKYSLTIYQAAYLWDKSVFSPHKELIFTVVR